MIFFQEKYEGFLETPFTYKDLEKEGRGNLTMYFKTPERSVDSSGDPRDEIWPEYEGVSFVHFCLNVYPTLAHNEGSEAVPWHRKHISWFNKSDKEGNKSYWFSVF